MTGFVTTNGNYTGKKLELELRKYLNKVGKKGLHWDASAIYRLMSTYGNAHLSVEYCRKSRRIKNGYHVGHAYTAGDVYEFYAVFSPALGPLLEGYLSEDDTGKPTIRRHLTMTTDGQFRLF